MSVWLRVVRRFQNWDVQRKLSKLTISNDWCNWFGDRIFVHKLVDDRENGGYCVVVASSDAYTTHCQRVVLCLREKLYWGSVEVIIKKQFRFYGGMKALNTYPKSYKESVPPNVNQKIYIA